jgi:hypothetical protein
MTYVYIFNIYNMFLLSKKEFIPFILQVLIGIRCILLDSKLFEFIILFATHSLLVKERHELVINRERIFILESVSYSILIFNTICIIFTGGILTKSVVCTFFIIEAVYRVYANDSILFTRLDECISIFVFMCIFISALIVYIPFKIIQYYIFGVLDNRYIPDVPNYITVRFKRRRVYKKNVKFIAG